MEYQQKKEQILTNIQFTNLLTFSLTENKLERNFKSIVEALLLNQNKTDQVINKTDQLEDRLVLERQKSLQEQENMKQALKHLSERISKLQNNPPTLGQTSNTLVKENDKKQIKQTKQKIKQQSRHSSKRQLKQEPTIDQKLEPTKKQISLVEYSLPVQRSSAANKKIEDILRQIDLLKDKMPELQLLQGSLDNMKRDIATLKGEVMTLNNRSAKAIVKRDSTVNIAKRQTSSKLGKSSIINVNRPNSIALLQEAQNKENIDLKQSVKEVIKESTSKVEAVMSQLEKTDNGEIQKDIQGLHVQVNTLQLCFEQLKVLIQDLRKKDIKYRSTLFELDERQKKMQDEMRKDSQTFEKQIKNLQVDILNFETDHPKEQNHSANQETNGKKNKGSNNNVENEEPSSNYKNQINDKLSKLQNSLQGFVTQNEFNRFKTESRSKIQDIEKKHEKFINEYEQQIKKIYDLLINKDLDINRLGQLINTTSETIKQNSAQADRKHNIAIARSDQLKKNLQNLREDVQFYQSLNADNKKNAESQNKAENTATEEQTNKGKGNFDPKALQDLKRYFNNKLHDQRAYLIGLVRDLEKKQQAAGGVNQQIANIWDKVHQFTLFLSKKAESEDIKKSLIYLEKKINRLADHMIKSEENTEDSTLARKNWFCLSCDKGLIDYQGRLGKHAIWEALPLKGLVKTLDKRSLPSLKMK